MTTEDEVSAEARQMAGMTLQDIEHDDWGDPSTGETDMIARCLELRRTPLSQFDDEDVRLLIGQRISLQLTVPMALGMLQVDPWLGGGTSLGTLLRMVAGLKPTYWQEHPDQETMLNVIVEKQVAAVSDDPWLVARDYHDYDPPEIDYTLFMLLGLPTTYWHAHQTIEEQLSVAVDQIIAKLDDDPWYVPPSEPGQEPPGALCTMTDLPDAYLDNHLDQAARITIIVDKALTVLEHNPWHSGPEWMVPGWGLSTLMDLPGYPWDKHPDQKIRLYAIVQRVIGVLESNPGFVPPGDSRTKPGQVLSCIAMPYHDYWESHPEQAQAIQNINAQTIAYGTS